ncbi:MAG: putative Ig domain-containing protein, partial [Prevotellaceae bacterium]|nr:putative Ig domain-containing protein [Prevotellaceae bacterium]
MKNYTAVVKKFILLTFCFLCFQTVHGQNGTTFGRDFWLSYGRNVDLVNDNYGSGGILELIFQIRFVATENTTVNLEFTKNPALNSSINVSAGQVYTKTLTPAEMKAVHSKGGRSNSSLHITSSRDISLYIVNMSQASNDATNVLPLDNLGTEYYHLGYTSAAIGIEPDGCLIVATEDGTTVHMNGTQLTTLKKGDVYAYYPDDIEEVTGYHFTASKPVAYFSSNSCALIPKGVEACDCLFQQLAPVTSWGKNFLIPVTNRGKDRARIVASENGTEVQLAGGSIKGGNYTQSGSSVILNAGQFVEIEVEQKDNGCFVSAAKPVAVNAYLMGSKNFIPNSGDPAMAMVPPFEQTIPRVVMAPFAQSTTSLITDHYAIIITPAASKNSTTFSVGGGKEQALSGGKWTDNLSSGYSYYTMKLTNPSATYVFDNSAGLSAMGYGLGSYESYYYLAGAGARKLDFDFYVNEIHYLEIDEKQFCLDRYEIRADIKHAMHSDPGHLKWTVDGIDESAAADKILWEKILAPGEHTVAMTVKDEYGDVQTLRTAFTVLGRPNIETDDLEVCKGGNIEFKLKNPSPRTTYQWFADNSYGNKLGEGLAFKPAADPEPGVHHYYIKAGDSGCESEGSVKLTVGQPPSVTAMDDLSVCFGQEVKLEVKASDGNLKWTLNGSAVSGTSFKPAAGSSGEYTVTASKQGCADASDKVTITAGDSLYITPQSLPPCKESQAYEQTLLTISNPSEFRIVSGSLPNGLAFDPATGKISGTPANATGASTFTVEVKDAVGCPFSREYTLDFEATASFSVNDIVYVDLIGQSFCRKDYLVKADVKYQMHPDQKHLLWFVNGAERTDAADRIEWSDELADGNYEIIMKVKNQSGAVEELKGSFNVVSPPSVTAMDDVFLCYGEQTELKVTQSDGNLEWTLNGSVLGSLTVKPPKNSINEYAVKASKNHCPDATDAVTVAVGDSLYVMPQTLPLAHSGQTYSVSLSLNANDGKEYKLKSGALPDGLSLNPSSGEISGTPTGTNLPATFTVEATDSHGCVAEREYTVSTVDEGDAYFEVDTVHYIAVNGQRFCRNVFDVEAFIDYPYDELRWLVDGVENLPAKNQRKWTAANLSEGAHKIEMITKRQVGAIDRIDTLRTSISVVYPPSVTAMDDLTICYGEEAKLEVKASDGDLKWSFNNAALGNTTVKPPKNSVNEYAVRASKDLCPDAADTVTITVRDSLYISTESLPQAGKSAAYSAQLDSNLENAQYSVVAGDLPEGLSLSADGRITGTPAGNKLPAAFTVQAADAYGCIARREYRIIEEGEADFYVTEIHDQVINGQTGCVDNYDIKANIGYAMSTAKGHLRWLVDGAEEDLAEDHEEWTKILSEGTHSVSMITVRDDGATDTLETSFTVLAPPAVTAMHDTALCFGESVTLSVVAVKGGTPVWSVANTAVSPEAGSVNKYFVTVDGAGCPQARDSVTVTVRDSLYIVTETLP